MPQTPTAMRVIADHARATTFLVADGVLPSNEGRGYVLRRIMRRAIRYGRGLGLDRFFTAACLSVCDTMSAAYPHLEESRELLVKVSDHEEMRFGETLDHGLALLDEEIERIAQTEQPMLLRRNLYFRSVTSEPMVVPRGYCARVREDH